MTEQTAAPTNTSSEMAAKNPFMVAPPPLRRSRSLAQVQNKLRQTTSPTRRKISGDIFADLTPDGILDLFANASGGYEASIEAAGPELRELGKRAAVASGYIHEWYNEVKLWPWPQKLSEGFLTPAGEDPKDYFGSLRKDLLMFYKERLHEIRDGLDYLNVREIHQRVREFNCVSAGPSSPTSPMIPVARPFSSGSDQAPKIINKFEILITHTTVEALPKLGQLEAALLNWQNRLSILEQVPPALAALNEAETALEAARSVAGYTRHQYSSMEAKLAQLCRVAGRAIDHMLALVERGDESLPVEWIDRIDALEEDFRKWSSEMERDMRASETAELARLEAQSKKVEESPLAVQNLPSHIEPTITAQSTCAARGGQSETASEAVGQLSLQDPLEQADTATRSWAEDQGHPKAASESSPKPASVTCEMGPATAVDITEHHPIESCGESYLNKEDYSTLKIETGEEVEIDSLNNLNDCKASQNAAAEITIKIADDSSSAEYAHGAGNNIAIADTDDFASLLDSKLALNDTPPLFDHYDLLRSSEAPELAEPGNGFDASTSSSSAATDISVPSMAPETACDQLTKHVRNQNDLQSTSSKPGAKTAKGTDSQLFRHVSGIVSALPGNITLRKGANGKANDGPSTPKTPTISRQTARQQLKRQTSRPTLSTAPRPSPFSRPPSPSFTRGSPQSWRRSSLTSPANEVHGLGHEHTPPIPSPAVISTGLDLTLVPLDPRHPNYRHDNISGHIHISRGEGRPPLVIYVTLSGSGSNVVQVRVGGGYQELSQFLREYQAHHGTRIKVGEVEDFVILPLDRHNQHLGSGPRGTGAWASPNSRPGSSLGAPKGLKTPTQISGSSLRVTKRGARRSDGGSSAFEPGSMRERSVRIPTSPLPQMVGMLDDSPQGSAAPSSRSVSYNSSISGPAKGKATPLGPAFVLSPAARHGHLPASRERPRNFSAGQDVVRSAMRSVERSARAQNDKSAQLKRESWVQNVYDIVSSSVEDHESKVLGTPQTALKHAKESTPLSAKRNAGAKKFPDVQRPKNASATPARSTKSKFLATPVTRYRRGTTSSSGSEAKTAIPSASKEEARVTDSPQGTRRVRRVSSEPKLMHSSQSGSLQSNSHSLPLTREGSVVSFESIEEDAKE